MRVGRGGASSRPPQVRGDCRGLRLGQRVERARRRTDLGGRQPEVARRGFQPPMTEQQLTVFTFSEIPRTTSPAVPACGCTA